MEKVLRGDKGLALATSPGSPELTNAGNGHGKQETKSLKLDRKRTVQLA